MQPITPKIARYGEAGPGPRDTVMTVSFEINGQQFTALNRGPQFRFSEAISSMLQMRKLDIAALRRAHQGGG